MRAMRNMAASLVVGACMVGGFLACSGCIIMGEGCGFASWMQPTVDETRTLSVAHVENCPLDVRTENGSVSVAKSDSAEVVITAKVSAISKERLDKVKVLAERADGGTLRISAQWPDGGRKSNEGCSFEIKTPGVSKTTVVTSNGSVSLDGLSGDASLESSNGEISARRHNGIVDARTSNGAVVLKGIRSGKAATSNGEIDISLAPDAPGPIQAETSNGAISLAVGEGFRGTIKADTSNGHVTNHAARAKASGSETKHHGEWVFGDGGEKSVLSSSNGSISIEQVK